MPIRKNAVDYAGLWDGRPDNIKYQQPKLDQELAAELKTWFQKSYQYRLPWERTWNLNRLFLKGDQLLARNKTTGEIVRLTTEDAKKYRSNNNVLRWVARSLVGKLSKMIPTYVVDPATADFKEQEASDAGDAILQYVRQKEDLDRVYCDLNGYLPWAGNAFAELVWDPTQGLPIAWCQTCNFVSRVQEDVGTPCPSCIQQRNAELQVQQLDTETNHVSAITEAAASVPPSLGIDPKEIAPGGLQNAPPAPMSSLGPLPPGAEIPLLTEAREGDTRVLVRDPRDVFLPPGIINLADATRAIIREMVEVSEACRRYPDFAQFFTPDAQIEYDRSPSYRYQGPGTFTGWEELNDHVFIYRCHERPTELYPKGRLITMVNGLIVEELESPYYKLGRLPLYHFGMDIIEGEFWRDCPITHAWHRQRALNKLETQVDEHVDQILRPKWLNPIGSRITASEMRSDTAQVIDYNPAAGKVEVTPTPQISQSIWQRKPDLIQDMRALFSVTGAETGDTPTDPNGRAMAIINAEADQQIGPIIQHNNAEWRELHRGILIMYQEYATPDKVGVIAGEDGVATIYFNKLFNLRPGWDVRMEQEEGSSRNPVVRKQEAIQLAQIGYFADPATGGLDKKAFARYAKLRVPDKGADLEAVERAAAAQVPELLRQGIPHQPRQWDVPSIWREVLEAWLRGPGRTEDQSLVDQVEQVWEFYVMAAAQGMQAGQGPMGGAGGPSAPGGLSAPGGTPDSPMTMPGVGPGQVAKGQAQMQVNQADKTGEAMARGGQPHES